MAQTIYGALTPDAKETIRCAGFELAEFCRRAMRPAMLSDLSWYGDSCGCTDDRCVGYHHDESGECGCLPVILSQMREGSW